MDWFATDVKTLIVVAACLLLLKFFLNLSRFIRMNRYLRKYKKWHSSRDEKFLESKGQVIRLLKEAGVNDARISVSQPVGPYQLQVIQASVLDNFPQLDRDMSSAAQRLMREAIGIYRARMLETFNPRYWIEFLIYLPREVLGFLGVPAEKLSVKISQLVWWIIATLLSLLVVLYRPEIKTVVSGWLGL
jgi:hypothetical protein